VDVLVVSELRRFIEALASGSQIPASRRLPRALTVLARQALPGRSDEVLADTVQDLLVKILEAVRAQSAGSPDHLLCLDDTTLLAVLRHRLRQVACTGSRWAAMKALRGHVKAVLGIALPLVARLPLTIIDQGRVSRPLVAEATAALLGRPDAPPRSVAAIADELLALYFSRKAEIHGLTADVPTDTTEDLVAAQYDGYVEARKIERVLGTDLSRVLGQRAAGHSLRAIAASCGGVAISTIHARLRTAERRLAHAHLDAPEQALQALAASGGR